MWQSLAAKTPMGFHPSVIAIDGPLLPFGANRRIRRHVESIFLRAPFTIVADPDSAIMALDWLYERMVTSGGWNRCCQKTLIFPMWSGNACEQRPIMN
jgi:hypothetical protein